MSVPIIFPCLDDSDAPAAIEWLVNAFGFSKHMSTMIPDGQVAHTELSLGPAVIMLSSARPDRGWVSPRDLQALSQLVSVTIDDPDARFSQARSAGATILQDVRNKAHGSRGDLEGNQWYFGTYRPGASWTK
ncbi:MAG: hypothetical protein K1X74_20045 [Pirellulales bacterium]|nr:hypothetical protein [Pirellulales bacterium]